MQSFKLLRYKKRNNFPYFNILCSTTQCVCDNKRKGLRNMKNKFKQWAKAAGVRALKTAAQTAVATIGTTAMFDEINWAVVGSTTLLAAVLSILTSIAGLPEVNGD